MQTATLAAKNAIRNLIISLVNVNDLDKAKHAIALMEVFDQKFPTCGLTSEEMAKALTSKLEAIKMHRTRTGAPLKESLDVVNAYLESQGIKT